MNNFIALFSLLEQKGLIPAAIPSTAFVLVTLFLFDPLLGVSSAAQGQTFADPGLALILLAVIFIVVLSYILTALNAFILKLFEGYVQFPPIRFLYRISRKIHARRAHRLMQHLYELESDFRNMKHKLKPDPKDIAIQEKLKDEHYRIAIHYNLTYPEHTDEMLPTRFGNILRAAENYSRDRYGFDGVALWPRLVQVIPAEYKVSIDHARNELSFSVNMATLSAIFAFFCLIASAYSLVTTANENVVPYLAGTIFGIISCVFFYNVSVFSVSSFGAMIRSSFDLFRLDLLKKLGLPTPRDSVEEYQMWQNLNEMINLGHRSLTFTKLNYENAPMGSVRSDRNAETVHLHNVIYPKLERESTRDEQSIQVDLGGITLNLGDFMKGLSAMLQKNQSKQAKKPGAAKKKVSVKQSKRSSSKSKERAKNVDRQKKRGTVRSQT